MIDLQGGSLERDAVIFPRTSVKGVAPFLAAPVPIAFAVGMALDARSPVAVPQWYAPESA